MHTDPNTFDALMARLADGDRAVFSSVFEHLRGPIHRFCVSLLKHEADAADATQEAMQKILLRASDYDKTRRAMPWASGIGAWQCRTLSRKRVRRREAEETDCERGGEHPEEEFVRRSLTAAAVATLGELSDADRETLLATFWDEASLVSGVTLRKRRQRALARLRKTFRRLYGLD